MSGRIVVGVDGSEPSEQALRWALEEGRLRRARVVAVYAYEAPTGPAPDLSPTAPVDFPGLITEAKSEAEGLVAELVERAVGDDQGADVEALAIEGPAASVLIDAAADADLVVVGSRGHGGFVGLLVGSVSQQVVNHAPCPVLVHRARSS